MDYKRQKTRTQRKPRPLRDVLVSLPPKHDTAWDIWQGLTPEQQAQLSELGAQLDAAMGYPQGASKWAILDLAAYQAPEPENARQGALLDT